jgi:hypothetical protein
MAAVLFPEPATRADRSPRPRREHRFAQSEHRHCTKKDGEAYTALDELTWGYSWHECASVMPPVLPPGSTPVPAPSPSADHCTEWLFLNANTGVQIVLTWQ